MMEMRTALVDLLAAIEAIPTRHVLPPQSRRATFIAMQKITGGLDVPAREPAPDRLKAAWITASAHCTAGKDPNLLPSSILRDIVWLLWDHGRPASALPGLLPVIQERALGSPLTLRRFIEVWLRDFDPSMPHLADTGRWIAGVLVRNDHPRHALWRKAQETHRLFDAVEGPARLARELLTPAGRATLTELGFNSPQRAAGGYMRAVVTQFGAALPNYMRGPGAAALLERAKQVYLPDEVPRFNERLMLCRMADALVGPWVSGHGPHALRDDVLDLLRTHVGDPRTASSQWADATGDTRRIVRSWLARVTLSAFFDVIGKHADAEGVSHQWTARRKFWSACLQKDWISNSWLALGANVRRNVVLDKELRGSYGRLVESRVANHSALMMRIGQTVFVEWSHNGKLYAWPANGGSAPRFGHTGTYSYQDLTSAGLAFPPPTGRPDLAPSTTSGLIHSPHSWQGRVAALLRQREKLRIQPEEWV